MSEEMLKSGFPIWQDFGQRKWIGSDGAESAGNSMNQARNEPMLDGFTFVSWLGGGGFADVFLFDQHSPERRVAVKVLRDTVDDPEARVAFNAEANLMAKVSAHPNIVNIYGTGVSRDRRPYLVMEYYPSEHLGDRMKRAPLSVSDVLEVGIKIASAVEVAHQAGIFHRDIKPANILTSSYGEPGLTDFGISGSQTADSNDESAGYSPPYAPPEILADEMAGDAQSDVYSLAATLWALLAGHSPFERPTGSNSKAEVIARGLNEPAPALPRGDVPSTFEHALRNALSKSRSDRPTSARSFALTLQAIERELGYQVTPLRGIQDTSNSVRPVDKNNLAGEKTKHGRGKVVNPDGPVLPQPVTTDAHTQIGSSHRSDGFPGNSGPTGTIIGSIPPVGISGGGLPGMLPAIESLARPVAPEEPGTIRKPVPQASNPVSGKVVSADPPRKLSRGLWLASAGGLAALLAVVGFVVIGGKGSTSKSPQDTSAGEEPSPLTVAARQKLEAVSGIGATKAGSTAHFSWKPSSSAGVSYIVTRIDDGAGSPPTSVVVTAASFDVVGLPTGSAPCISVHAFVPGSVEAPKPAPTKCAAG